MRKEPYFMIKVMIVLISSVKHSAIASVKVKRVIKGYVDTVFV